MNQHLLVYPMFAMVCLTVVVLVALFRSRTRAVAEGQVSAEYFKTYQGSVEPESSLQLSRHFVNLFETPLLFYVVCLATMVVGQVDLLLLILAWLYVVLRIVHAYIHTGSNRLQPRIAAYFSSIVVLLSMWSYLVVVLMLSS